VVALLDAADAGPHSLDDSGTLVARDHRHHERDDALDDRQVGVADAARLHADAYLACMRFVDLDIGDVERLVEVV